MTEREFDVLRSLDDEQWRRPRMIGATDGSHHSATLRRLTRRGLIDWQKSHSAYCHAYGSGVTINAGPCGCKGSVRYRRTPAGRTAALGNPPAPGSP